MFLPTNRKFCSMPHITNPTFNRGRIRELHTEEGYMKYVPPQGGELNTYNFDTEATNHTKKIEQVKLFLLGHIPAADLTALSDQEFNLAVYGQLTVPE
jgi:hypothetical protein